MARKKRPLAPEEKALWRRIAQSVRPMHGGESPAPPSQDAAAPEIGPGLKPDTSTMPAAPGPVQAAPIKTGSAHKAPASPPTPPQPGAIDPTSLKKIRRGGRPIDAKIDLHGLYQDQAFEALSAFLALQRARGARTVIVVTGKGAKRRPGAGDDGDFGRSAPGVLRRSAPGWFTGPLAAHVAAFSTAGPKHGGDGAFYVTLRKPAGDGRIS